MKTEFDVSVIVLANSMEDYGTSALLISLSPEERTEKLEELFLLAASKPNPNDETVLRYYKLLQQGFLDIEAAPRVEETEGVTVYTHNERDAMRFRADKACSLKTMELYGTITGFKMLVGGKYVRDKKWADPKDPALLKTRKAMLNSVLSQWEYTQDDNEADLCFMFLRVAFKFALFPDERNFIDSAMRKATDGDFPLLRLVRHYQLIPLPAGFSLDWQDEKIAEILGIGLVKNIRKAELAKVLRTIQPLLEIPMNLSRYDNDAVFALSEKSNREIVRFDAAVKELLAMMQPEDWSKDKVPGNIKISYPGTGGKVNVAIDILSDFSPLYGKEYDSSEAYRWFELARDYIIKWCEQHVNYSASLTLVVKQGNRDKQLFSQSQNFGKK